MNNFLSDSFSLLKIRSIIEATEDWNLWLMQTISKNK